MKTIQCTYIIDSYQCIYVEGHSGEHYAPQDGNDHSDEIRVKVLHDNCNRLEGENAGLRKALEAIKRELKPCPFCGNQEPFLDCLTDEDEYFVRCPSCEIQQIADHTRAHAIDEWNRRSGGECA